MENVGYIKGLINQFASAGEEKIAFSIYDGKQIKEITYLKFGEDILKTAGYFRQNNIKNQHIAIISDSDYRFYVLFLSIVASGNTAVILNPSLPLEMLRGQCEKADVSFIYTSEEVCKELNFGIENVEWLSFAKLQIAAPIKLSELHNDEADETILLVFTSGTTGKSKAVELTSANLKSGAASSNSLQKEKNSRPCFYAVPNYHIAGLRSIMVSFVWMETILIGRGVKYTFADMAVFNPGSVVLVPIMAEYLVKIFQKVTDPEERQKYTGKYLEGIVVGGATMNVKLGRKLAELGFSVGVSYGMTETSGAATVGRVTTEWDGSIGIPTAFSGVEMRIEDGEILIKGPNVMKGYYKDPEETACILKDGWIHSGDIGYRNENGYYYIVGRKKNIIILSNGENVCPEEIEEKFAECEAIQECMVYSDGKGICADVYASDENVVNKFLAQYNESVPMYRQVRKVNYCAEPLEKTGSGKIKRKENVYA